MQQFGNLDEIKFKINTFFKSYFSFRYNPIIIIPEFTFSCFQNFLLTSPQAYSKLIFGSNLVSGS